VESVKVTPRERALLAGLAACGTVFGAITAMEWSDRVRLDAAQVQAERETLEVRAARQAPGLAEERVAEQLAKARTMAFSASTAPIARAAAQAQLERMANQSGVANVRVTPQGEPAGDGALRTQVYALQGQFDWPSFLALIQAIADAPQSVGVLGVSVDAGPSPSFALRVRAPLVTDSAG
jgi:hypothetical protein